MRHLLSMQLQDNYEFGEILRYTAMYGRNPEGRPARVVPFRVSTDIGVPTNSKKKTTAATTTATSTIGLQLL